MINLSVTGIIRNYHCFEREFWLSYKALEMVMAPNEWENVKMMLLKSKRIDEKLLNKIDRNQYELKKAEIDAEWKQKNEDAKVTGIATHEYLHNLLCTDLASCKAYGIPTDIYQVIQTEKFMESSGLFPEFRMEVKLDDEYLLVGIADLIIKDGNKIKIIDYKTDEKIDRDSHFDISKKKKKCMKYPLSKLPDCNLTHYQIQLSLYAWMLQKLNKDLKIDELELIHIRDNKVKKTYIVDYLKDDVENLIKWHLKSTKLKTATNKCKEKKYIYEKQF